MTLEVIKVTPPLVKSLDCSKAHPRYYTTTLYDSNGKLLDDGYITDKQVEKSYWEAFVDNRQARELERRLAIVESPDYTPGSVNWEPIVVEDNDEQEEDE